MISKEHYHIITWKDSKYLGQLRRCPSKNCVHEPAYDKRGKRLLI